MSYEQLKKRNCEIVGRIKIKMAKFDISSRKQAIQLADGKYSNCNRTQILQPNAYNEHSAKKDPLRRIKSEELLGLREKENTLMMNQLEKLKHRVGSLESQAKSKTKRQKERTQLTKRGADFSSPRNPVETSNALPATYNKLKLRKVSKKPKRKVE